MTHHDNVAAPTPSPPSFSAPQEKATLIRYVSRCIQGEFKVSQMHESYIQVNEEEKTHTQSKQNQLYHKHHPQKVDLK